MSKKGVSKISGNTTPKVGEKTTYTITDWYSGTPKEKRNPALVTWELFKKRSNGRFTTTSIKKTGDGSFTFGEVAQKHTYRLEAYLYEPEGQGSSIIEINPQPVEIPKINKVELFYVDDSKGTVFSYMEKLVAKAQCVNLAGEKLTFTLWEDDAKGDGHNAGNLFIDKKEATVGKSGVATAEFALTKALMQKAMSGETDQKELEFYVTVEYYKNKKHATDNVDVKNPEYKAPAVQSKPTVPPKAKGSPAIQKPASKKEEKGIIDKAVEWWNELWDFEESKGTVKPSQKPTQQKPGGRTVSIVQGQSTTIQTSCLCKELYKDLIWGGKVSCEFRKKVVKIAQSLGLPQQNYEGANWLMAVMALETGRGFDPTAGTFKSNQDDNREGGYVGLIQFGKGASIDLGVKRTGLIKMTAEKQLDYVEKHFLQKRFQGKLKTKTDLYLAVNYPKACGHGTERDYVVYDSTKAAYDDNPMFKREADEYWIDKKGKKRYYEGREGKSYVWEFEEAINDFYNEGKSVKATTFTCQNVQASKATAKDIVTYHIYNDGRIEKHIPKVVKEEYKKKYKYIYHDKDGGLHEMGTYDIIPTQMVRGKKGTLINLINFDKVTKTYKKGTYQYTFNVDSPRKYVNEKTLASLFGAMLEVNYNDISCNGFSHSDGSSRPSVSHINGNNGDFKYLRKDKKLMFGDGTSLDISANPDMLDDVRQNKWNDALNRFGWKSMLGWTYRRNGKVNYLHHLPKNTANHHHHLHLQGYSPNFKEIKE
ncbi:hypothetical protein [Chryseobacterium populi]|uniref:Uncharacterized protein n=1 Tax=Chryseobacterium populi TaxID=1144316 RepID=J2K254_9FLAO|nr:hypothetical protein [Chryseobacterium populi]EJL74230.1 hypothetical protein PMI13_00963 [Chryseobacterium populi]